MSINKCKRIQRWLHKHDFEVTFIEDEDTYYNCIKDELHFSFTKCIHCDNFIKYCHKLGLKKSVSWEVLTLLHELGHYETMDTLPELYYYIDYLKNIIETPSYTMFGVILKSNIYYRLPLEKAATLWAIDYIESNDVSDLEELFMH